MLIEHARLLVHNSTSRIERVEKRLQGFVIMIEAAEATDGAAGKRLSALIARRREAA